MGKDKHRCGGKRQVTKQPKREYKNTNLKSDLVCEIDRSRPSTTKVARDGVFSANKKK